MQDKRKDKIIEIVNLTRQFDDGVVAVDDISFYVRRGEFVTFLGPSGCGKTTTLRMIAGFDKPTSGKILLNGQDISALPPNKRPINTVFQRYALFPHLNVFDNIAFGLKLKRVKVTYEDEKGNKIEKIEKLKRTEILAKVQKALKMVDLEGFEKRSVSTLSGGQQQRVAIARAIVTKPEIVLADEPTGQLDSETSRQIMEILEKLNSEGITVLVVTHDAEVAAYAKRCLFVTDGCVSEAV